MLLQKAKAAASAKGIADSHALYHAMILLCQASPGDLSRACIEAGVSSRVKRRETKINKLLTIAAGREFGFVPYAKFPFDPCPTCKINIS